MRILTLSFDLVRVSAPHYLPCVLPDLERSPLGPLGLLLVEDGHHRAHLQAVEDAGTCLCPVQHPGGHDRTSSPCCTNSTTGCGGGRGLLCTAIEAATKPGCTHLHCIATRKPHRITNLLWFLQDDACPLISYCVHRGPRPSNMSKHTDARSKSGYEPKLCH